MAVHPARAEHKIHNAGIPYRAVLLEINLVQMLTPFSGQPTAEPERPGGMAAEKMLTPFISQDILWM